MKWLLICDPVIAVEEYGDVLPGVPSDEERAGCPESYRALYLDADVERVRPLASDEARVCRLRPVWEQPTLSPAELLILGRRIEYLREDEEKRDEPQAPGPPEEPTERA